MKEYNTTEIRAAARKLDNIADQLQSLKSTDVTRISRSAKPLKGDTATALQDQLDTLAADVLTLKKGVDQVAAALFEFARQLDIADAKAKAMIQST